MANMLMKLFHIFISKFKSFPKPSIHNVLFCYKIVIKKKGEKRPKTAKFYNVVLYVYIVTSIRSNESVQYMEISPLKILLCCTSN